MFSSTAFGQGAGLRRAPTPHWPDNDGITSRLTLSGGNDPFRLNPDGGVVEEAFGRLSYSWFDAPHYEDRYIPFAYEPYVYRYGFITVGPTYRSRSYDIIGVSVDMSKFFAGGWFLEASLHPENARSRHGDNYLGGDHSLYSRNSLGLLLGRYTRSYQIGAGITATSLASSFADAVLFKGEAATMVGVPLAIEVTPTSYSRYRFTPTYFVGDADSPLDWAYALPLEFWLTTPVYWTELFLGYTYGNNDRSIYTHRMQAQFRKYFENTSILGEFSMYRMKGNPDTEVLFFGGGLEGNSVTGDLGIQLTAKAGYEVKRIVGTDDLDVRGGAVYATLNFFFRD